VLLSSLLWCCIGLFIRLAVRDHHAAGARRAARTCITRDEIIVADLITGARRLHTRPVLYVLEVLLEFILLQLEIPSPIRRPCLYAQDS
jgi:hypothetical protein